jgi:hypothetical protein
MRLLIILLLVSFYYQVSAQITKDEIVSVANLGKIIIEPNHTWKFYRESELKQEKDIAYLDCDSMLLGKYVSNKGEGDFLMSGIRNARTVLNGVVYRGGGNNKYNPVSRRDNNNPLSIQSIIQLSKIGFKNIIYLYNKNFEYYYSSETLDYLKKKGINYSSIVPNDDSTANLILNLIHRKITNQDEGPIYLHCWNGWHMSGLISAYALMQFCDFNKKEAWEYWKSGTDGNYKGYERIKKRIDEFKVNPEITISLNEKLKICPCVK